MRYGSRFKCFFCMCTCENWYIKKERQLDSVYGHSTIIIIIVNTIARPLSRKQNDFFFCLAQTLWTYKERSAKNLLLSICFASFLIAFLGSRTKTIKFNIFLKYVCFCDETAIVRKPVKMCDTMKLSCDECITNCFVEENGCLQYVAFGFVWNDRNA